MPSEANDAAAKPQAATMNQPPAATMNQPPAKPTDAEFVAAFAKSTAAMGKAPTQYVNVRAGDLARLVDLAARAIK